MWRGGNGDDVEKGDFWLACGNEDMDEGNTPSVETVERCDWGGREIKS